MRILRSGTRNPFFLWNHDKISSRHISELFRDEAESGLLLIISLPQCSDPANQQFQFILEGAVFERTAGCHFVQRGEPAEDMNFSAAYLPTGA